MPVQALMNQPNKDLEWSLDSIQQRRSAAEFVLQFERRLCIYSASVEQLYTNYTINFPNSESSKMVILPNPYAFHDTFNGVTPGSLRDTGLYIIPGDTIGRQGLYLIAKFGNHKVEAAPIPFRHALRKILSTQAGDDPFLPVLVKGDLREFNSNTPALHLHRIRLNDIKGMSQFDRQGMKKSISEKLMQLYKEADNLNHRF